MYRRVLMSVAVVIFLLVAAKASAVTPLEELGEFLYFDETLSQPDGQSCASCHLPSSFFVDTDS
jgi:cytochrome c peroxidase